MVPGNISRSLRSRNSLLTLIPHLNSGTCILNFPKQDASFNPFRHFISSFSVSFPQQKLLFDGWDIFRYVASETKTNRLMVKSHSRINSYYFSWSPCVQTCMKCGTCFFSINPLSTPVRWLLAHPILQPRKLVSESETESSCSPTVTQ